MEGAADPFPELKDIHLPVDPTIWPPAPGWWFMALVIILLVWFLVNTLTKYYQQIKPGREIRNQLLSLEIQDNQENKILTVQKMSKLVRQFAIHRYGREKVAGLFGNDWLTFLDSTSEKSFKGKDVFSSGVGKVLGDAQYAKHLDVDLDKLRQLLIKWSKYA